MGTDRGLNQDKPTAEVFKRIIDEFGVPKEQLVGAGKTTESNNESENSEGEN